MPTQKTSIPTINVIVDFIEKNDLGPIDFFDVEENKRVYDELEKKRLDMLLNIANDLVNKKLSINDLEQTIIGQLKIGKNSAEKISKEIQDSLQDKKNNEEGSPEEEQEEKPKINSGNEKSIFNALIK